MEIHEFEIVQSSRSLEEGVYCRNLVKVEEVDAEGPKFPPAAGLKLRKTSPSSSAACGPQESLRRAKRERRS